jgi:hypothetical protein
MTLGQGSWYFDHWSLGPLDAVRPVMTGNAQA